MKVGTKSVLFGAHCFLIHGWFVALAWWKLFGFRKVKDPYLGQVSLWDPRLWVVFFIHDLGYWGRPNMDGAEGELHPLPAASFMSQMFDHPTSWRYVDVHAGEWPGHVLGPWGHFCLFHSRFLSKRCGNPYSMLCVADKLAVALEPWWLYLPRVIATGEIEEYMSLARDVSAKYGSERRSKHDFATRREWQKRMAGYCRDWAYEHRDGKQDNWTPEVRQPQDKTGVWDE